MIYPICSVVAVFKMLVRILNMLPSRIWVYHFSFFLIILNPQFGNVECTRRNVSILQILISCVKSQYISVIGQQFSYIPSLNQCYNKINMTIQKEFMKSQLRCLFFVLNSLSLYNITQPWDTWRQLVYAQHNGAIEREPNLPRLGSSQLYRWGRMSP